MSDEQKKSLKDVHKNLVKVQAFGLQILESKTDNPVLVDLVEKLTSTLEESENFCLILSKAMKFSKLDWEGGFSKENVDALIQQGIDNEKNISMLAKALKSAS